MKFLISVSHCCCVILFLKAACGTQCPMTCRYAVLLMNLFHILMLAQIRVASDDDNDSDLMRNVKSVEHKRRLLEMTMGARFARPPLIPAPSPLPAPPFPHCSSSRPSPSSPFSIPLLSLPLLSSSPHSPSLIPTRTP